MTRSNHFLKIVIVLLLSILVTSCNNDDDAIDNCSANTICTLVFVEIIVSITDQNENPVALDAFEVTDIDTGNDMTIALSESEFLTAQQTGRYPLITDGILDVNQERRLQFRGFLNGETVVTTDYTVATDCCHIALISGNLDIMIE